MNRRGDDKPARGLRDLDDMEAIFGALGHATRRHLLQVLAAHEGSLTAGELTARFAHSWPTTTRHLGVLLDARLVSVASVGRERHYRIERQRLGDVLALWLRSVGFDVRESADGRPRR
ncbi:MAG: ArsR/SmtB family transcription factor [Acidimicrobiales bacterium]